HATIAVLEFVALPQTVALIPPHPTAPRRRSPLRTDGAGEILLDRLTLGIGFGEDRPQAGGDGILSRGDVPQGAVPPRHAQALASKRLCGWAKGVALVGLDSTDQLSKLPRLDGAELPIVLPVPELPETVPPDSVHSWHASLQYTTHASRFNCLGSSAS